MGAHGKEFVSNFTPDKMAGKYLELYQAVLGGKLK
jgi:hypothetical protein